MNKETIVRFLQQDIQELEMLTKGFEDMDKFPDAILDLASQKAKNISLNLSKLKEFGQMEYGAFNYDKVEEKKNEEQHHVLSGEKNGMLPVDSADIIIEEKLERFATATNTETETFKEEKEVAEQQENKHLKTEVEEVKTTQHIEEVAETKTAEDQLLKKQTLEESLSSQPIDDIRDALSIGDRFRFQRELFNNNGELMNKMIAYLNKLANYEEAEKFLKRKFNWSEDNSDAEDFLKIVKRRY